MSRSERVLVLAPVGRDAALAAQLLGAAAIDTLACDNLPALIEAISQGAGVAVVADEALQSADLHPLSTWIEGQSLWSDFPFIVLTRRDLPADSWHLARLLQVLGNVIFLERPLHGAALVGVVENALRARRRQYQARDFLEKLAEGEKRLSTALVAGRMGTWEYEPESGRFLASPEFKANFGFAPDAPMGFEDVLDAISPLDRERRDDIMRRAIETGEDYVIEFRCIWPDGSEHWVDNRARVQRDKRTGVLSLVGVSTDITARKASEDERDRLLLALAAERERTQEALRGEQALTDLLLNSAPAGIVAYDRSESITVWNPGMARLVGIEASDVVGRWLFDVISPELAPGMKTRVKAALGGQDGPLEELEFETEESGRVWLEVQHAPLGGGDGQVIGGVAFFRDMTERRRAEEQLRHAQKLETIGQLTGGVAHDFNNLLAAVIGNIELLGKRLPPDPQLNRYIEGAMQGALRGASLTQRLLAFARRQDLKPAPTDLGALLEGMKGLIERSAGGIIDIQFRIPAGLPPAVVDANQLELAILNLAVNARDAMPEGGTLTVGLSQYDAAPPALGLSGSFLCLSVSDTGSGMDRETLDKAIEPFFSTKELGKGTGLGLSMVHGLAEQLGGALKLTSEPGKGTVAEVWLPVADAPVTTAKEEEPMVTDTRASRILVVDDDALIAMNTVDMIEDLGHTVLEANSGKQALEILESGAPVDALVTDYAMPGMTGVELASRARQLRPNLPILLATGYAELPSGMTTDLPRLSKPYQQRDLARQLAQLLGSAPS